MANVPMGADITGIINNAIGAASSIYNSYNQRQMQENAERAALAQAQTGAGSSGGITDFSSYIPWFVGGILGVGVLIFILRR